jgi:hypothetical protein
MSAAFPYVSPAATPDWGKGEPYPKYHLVDGGYYDNYGLVALSQWLDDALEERASANAAPKAIVVIVVRGELGQPPVPQPWGWLRQLRAPPAAFLQTRSYGQWAGGNEALALIRDKWSARHVTIHLQLFDYPADRFRPSRPECAEPPLSWKLTREQRVCIEAAWALQTVNRAAVRALLAP